MIVSNNDGSDDDDDDAEADVVELLDSIHVTETDTGRSAVIKGRDGSAAVAAVVKAATASCPLHLGSQLTVMHLGRIEFLNQLFHNESHIYPVGYSAVRLLKSVASLGNIVPHRMEIVVSEDACKPLFRCGNLTITFGEGNEAPAASILTNKNCCCAYNIQITLCM